MYGFWDMEMIEIDRNDKNQWRPYWKIALIWFYLVYNAKSDINVLLIHNNTYLVTKIMILRCQDANIVEK